METNHAIVRSLCPGAECEAWLYVGMPSDECGERALYAVVRMPHRDNCQPDPDYPEGFHVAHVCTTHALKVLDKSEGA